MGDDAQDTAPAVESRRHDPVHLHVSTYVSVTAEQRREIVVIRDSLAGSFPTSCRKPGHRQGRAPKKYRDLPPDQAIWDLDCPCDVGCPKCGAARGMFCMTPTGYGASWHSQRVAASPRCQGLLEVTRLRCDMGEHSWIPSGTDKPRDATQAVCSRCGRREPIHDAPRSRWG